MTVPVQTPITSALANGATTVFPYNFLVLQASDLVVQVTDPAGVISTKTLGVDYTLTGIGSLAGGTVTFLVAPLNLSVVVNYRSTQLLRSTNYVDRGDFLAAIINADIDRVWLALQEISYRSTARALQAPLGETLNTLPAAAARASGFQAYDATGQPIIATGITGLPATAFGASLLATLTAATGRGLLGSGAIGDALFLTTTAAAARGLLGSTTLGDTLFSAASALLARAALEVEPAIKPIAASVAANALTLTLNPCLLNFRSATLTSGTTNPRTVAAAVSLVVPSTATLGTVSGQQSRLAVLAIDNAGTVEPAVVNLAGGTNLDETGVISTTAISAAATSASVVYSTTARSNVPYRVVAYVDSTQATAGTWATAPSTIQGAGGQAVSSLASIGYGQVWQTVTRNSGTTYYNQTGKPIMLNLMIGGASGGTVNSVTIGAADALGGNPITVGAGVRVPATFIIPPGAPYSYVLASGNAAATELR